MSFFKHVGYFLLGILFVASIPLLMALAIVGTVLGIFYVGGRALCDRDYQGPSNFSGKP
jgi:hypothetical protein